MLSEISCKDPGMGTGAQRSGNSLLVGDALAYSCQTGWEQSSGDQKITCQPDKTWSGVPLVCIRK